MTLKSSALNTIVEDRPAQRRIALRVSIRRDDEARAVQEIAGTSDPREYSSDRAMRGLILGIALELAFACAMALCWLMYRMVHG